MAEVGVSRIDNLRDLRNANIDAAFATAFVTLTTGAFLVGFVQSLGGNAFAVNLLSAIPSLAGTLQLPGSIWGRRFASYKQFVAPPGWIWRLMYVPFVVLPLLALPNEARLIFLTLCVAIGSIAVMTSNPIYNEWLAELVPSNSRGFFFGRRTAIATIVGAVVGIVGGYVLDAFRNAKAENVGFSVVFGVGVLFAAISFTFYYKMRDIPRQNPVRESLKEGIRSLGAPFGDDRFRRVLLFLAVGGFSQQFAGNLFVAFARSTLNLDYKVIQGAGMMHALGMILWLRLWGFVSDKYGNKPVLVLAHTLLALNPVPWILCTPSHGANNTWILLGTHPLMALGWSGVALCQFNLLLGSAKPEQRASFLGAGMAVGALIGGISPLLGAATFNAMQRYYPEETAYKIVFGLSVIMRVFAVIPLLFVKEEGARPIKDTLVDLGKVTPKGYRAMRSLARNVDAESRETAIHQLGTEGVALAGDAVMKALHDPSPKVRRQAATAIARLRPPEAAVELVHQIEEHPDLVEEETVAALGALEDPRAVPALVGLLHSPRSLLRRTSARALGRIAEAMSGSLDAPGSSIAEDALIGCASDPSDPDLRRASLQALRHLGGPRVEGAIIDALLDPLPSVRIAAAEAVVELNIRSAKENLRHALDYYDDEASSEVSYALGAVGDPGDLKLILQEAGQSHSIVTRRRCLLGIARLLGVEHDAYRLMLLDGMARDTALLEFASKTKRKKDLLQRALSLYTNGDEQSALIALTEYRPEPAVKILSEMPVEESFLIAIVVARV